jgi:hypothetical protein
MKPRRKKPKTICEGCDGRGTVFVETLARTIDGSEIVCEREICRVCGGTGKAPKEPR